jgi:type I restriction enzyme M protein
MLDTETKARIDSARDILVGKVPDPKSQVEQITIALIYKFMDDMDRQSEELGGKATFFAGEFKQYAWNHLVDKRLGGHERLLLYAEGIEKMNENKTIPQLFRDIFRGVFLPYRDPETLNLFLKTIDGFTYDHSERLGDAYEYLLNILGTQGDAGQFRTPRHIIDFIVTVVDPQKHETVLDPACGTAGFLISAYKHILKHNKNLSPDERARLMTNFCGYDIAPDMGRLSRVNLYLHGFPEPIIHEYDALTSEARWEERYDVIMANPPFMTPKGGIRPHKRFSITATRSEVLFVDYIAEHLNPKGRAGIIVPEGIIFQGQTAYKKLRRMLVENYLWAVVSLPAGVFNPYSGVKTSILFLDRNLVRRTDEVLFVKVANDGFDLGAQRRAINKNDLFEARDALEAWKTGHQKEPETQTAMTHAVSRKRLLESPDCNLSGDRHRPIAARISGKWPMVKIAEIASLLSGGTPAKARGEFWSGSIPWVSPKDMKVDYIYDTEDHVSEDAVRNSAVNLVPAKSILCVVRSGILAHSFPIALAARDLAFNQDITAIVTTDKHVLPEYLFHLLKGMKENVVRSGVKKGGTVHSLRSRFLHDLAIPLPPLDEQERVVSELEGYRKSIEGARQVIANYRPRFQIDPKWPSRKIGDFVRINNGGVLTKFVDNGRIACVKVSDMNLPANQREIVTSSHWVDVPPHEIVPENSVIFPKRGAAIATNKKRLTKIPCLIDNNCMALIITRPDELDSRYVFYFLHGFDLASISNSAGVALINNGDISSVQIPIPPLDIQRRIGSELGSELTLVDSNRKLIQIFEAKIKAKMDEIWGTTEEVTANNSQDPETEEQDNAEYPVLAGGFSTT